MRIVQFRVASGMTTSAQQLMTNLVNSLEEAQLVHFVTIDIKPGDNNPPSINPRSQRTIPDTGEETSLVFCNTGGEDVNRDGLPLLLARL
jgi:hypothetical protein